MKLYHRTSRAAADAIIAEGFRDGDYQIEGPDGDPTGGVELATPPFDAASLPRVKSEILLVVEIPDNVLEPWEWREEGSVMVTGWIGYPPREFLVPAKIVNRYGPPEVVEDQEEDDDD